MLENMLEDMSAEKPCYCKTDFILLEASEKKISMLCKEHFMWNICLHNLLKPMQSNHFGKNTV